MPTMIKAALAHVQFESIHPFLDGNGRLGRLLITLLLCHEKVIREPLLYLSLYFKQNRKAYYDLLQQVRTDGDWESWVAFFVDAIKETARQAVSAANQLSEIIRKDRNTVQSLGRISGSAYRVFDLMVERPLLSISVACRRTGLVPHTVTKVLGALRDAGIVKEITGRKRNKLFSYDRYMKILAEGTEPLP